MAKKKTNDFLKHLSKCFVKAKFGPESPPRSWFDKKVFDRTGEVTEATLRFEGWLDLTKVGINKKIPVYSNPTVETGVLFFINEETMYEKNQTVVR